MNNLDLDITIPKEKLEFLHHLASKLQNLSGIRAVALGGSYAEGTARAHSDLDIGLYYLEEEPFNTNELESVARNIAIDQKYTITDFYEWGPWVNGGAWIQTEVGKVDFLYRNLDQVRETIDKAKQGTIQHDYNQQPAYGFYSVTYLAETNICQPLLDSSGFLADLKQQVAVYPAKLKESILQESLWNAEFSLRFAHSFAKSGDVYNTVGCLTRIASNLTQALFALNETYFLGDKRAMKKIERFDIKPANYVQKLENILSNSGQSNDKLSETVEALDSLWQDIVGFAGKMYQQRFPS